MQTVVHAKAIAVRGINDVWFATTARLGQPASLWHYTGAGFPARYDHLNPLPGATNNLDSFNISCITFDSQNNMWIGAWDGTGASKYDFNTTTWTNYNYLQGSVVNDIDFDQNGRVWFATSQFNPGVGGGARYFDPATDAWFTWGPSNTGLGDYNVRCITFSSVDGIWFGTTTGAYLYNASKPPSKRWRVFNTSNTRGKYPTWHLPDNTVYDIKYGNYNNTEYIWFGTVGGGVGQLLANSIRNQPPKASFTIDPPFGDASETVFHFDATDCEDKEDPKPLLQVRWDWENDGTWDTNWSTVKILNHVFSKDGIIKVGLQVRDTEGLTGSTTRSVALGAAQPGVPGIGPYNAPSKIWYFAEGYTGPGFDEWLTYAAKPGVKNSDRYHNLHVQGRRNSSSDCFSESKRERDSICE